MQYLLEKFIQKILIMVHDDVQKCSRMLRNVWEMFDDGPAILFHSKTDSSNVHYSELSHIRGYYS